MCNKPEVEVFAGPNGSGKSTAIELGKTIGTYVNADEIQKANLCSSMEAAIRATEIRENLINQKQDFTFETVLSTDRNIKLLQCAKEEGYFIRGIYILTSNPEINVARVKSRVEDGGHDVPDDKIITRYYKSLNLIPEFVKICDVCHIYDNTEKFFRIYKKRKEEIFIWENEFWNRQQIEKLIGY